MFEFESRKKAWIILGTCIPLVVGAGMLSSFLPPVVTAALVAIGIVGAIVGLLMFNSE